MKIRLTAGARAFLAEQNTSSLTVSGLVFSSCCGAQLPPEVKPGDPGDTDGFGRFSTAGVTVFFDSLLGPRPDLTIDVKDYGSYRELFVRGWE